MLKYVLLILLFGWLSTSLKAQDLYGIPLDYRQGLLSKECYDLEYDQQGYLIVGTQFGVMKYNGETFQPICLNIPLESRFFYDLIRLPSGVIIGFNSKQELYEIKHDKATLFPIKNNVMAKIQGNQLTQMRYVNGNIILYTSTNCYELNLRTHRLSFIYSKKSHPTKHWLIELRNKHSTPFMNRINVDQLYNPSVEFMFQVPEDNIQFSFKNLLYNSHSREDVIKVGRTYFITLNGHFFKYQHKKLKMLPYSGVYFIRHLYNRIWLLSTNGLYELDENGNFIHLHFKDKLVGSMLPVGKRGLIIAFNRNSLLFIRDINERKYALDRPYQIEASPNHVLISTFKGNILTLNNNVIQEIANLKAFHTTGELWLVMGKMRYYPKSNEWKIAMRNDIVILDEKLTKIRHKKYAVHPKDFLNVKDFITNNKKTIIFSSVAIAQIAPKFKKLHIGEMTRCAIQIDSETALFGNNKQLLQLNINTGKIKPFIQELQGKTINYLLQNKGYIYVLTRYYGIYKIKNDKIISRIKPPCLSSNKLIFYQNNLYASGNMGVFRLKNETTGAWEQLFDSEILDFAICKNKLYVLTDYELITKNLYTNLSNENYLYQLKQISINRSNLKHFRNIPEKFNSSIQLKFDIVKFEATRKGLYYILSGNKTFKKKNAGTILNFDALEGGSYHLTVYPVIDDQIDFSKPKHFHFEIEYPFWQTAGFYFLIALILLLSFFAIRLLVALRKKRIQSERNQLQSKLNEYKLLAVKAQVNPHFLSNGLSAIQALILKNETERAAQYLAKFSLFMRRILNYSDQQFISISDELALTHLYLDLEKLRFKNSFEINIENRLSNEESDQLKIPSLMLQPILENAIWHGLHNAKTYPRLIIRIERNESHLMIQVEDNGPGIAQSPKNESHFSKGNSLIRERIETLNLQFGTQAASFLLESSSSGTIATFEFKQELIDHQKR